MDARRREESRIHFGLVLAEVICVPAFIFELSRAMGGNELSWAYVFEWPLLGGYAVYMWRKMIRDLRDQGARQPEVASPAPGGDPQLDAWNEYLAKRQATG